MQRRYDLGRADRLWQAIMLLRQELAIGHAKTEAVIERANWLIDGYEAELFSIIAKYDLNPRDYGYRLTSTQG